MSMTREDVVRIVREARANGAVPDLRRANLFGADLRNVDLRRANLFGADLRGANLSNAVWDGLRIDNLPSGQLTLTPTFDGWYLEVGCWAGTVDDLEALALSDNEADWPEARGEQIAHRRPLLLAAVTLCRSHIGANPGHHRRPGQSLGDWEG